MCEKSARYQFEAAGGRSLCANCPPVILDRIVHNAYRLELDGPSMRKLNAGEATDPTTSPASTIAAHDKPSKGAKK